MVGIEGTTGSLTATTHRAEVTEDNKIAVYSTGSNSSPVITNISGALTYENSLVVLDHIHYRISEGLEYQAGSYRISMPFNSSGGMLVNVGSISLHLALESQTDGDSILEFFENVSVSNSGTSLPIYNRKRDCGSTLNSTIWNDPTVTTSGLMIHSAFFLGGSGTDVKFQSTTVNISPEEEDIILSAGSSYWIKITNQCGRDMNLDYNFRMHEH